MDLTGARVVVVGLGKSGLSAFHFLKARGAEVALTDTRPPSQWPAGADPAAVPIDSLDLKQFTLMVLSPGVAIDDPWANAARDAGVRITGELELAAPFLSGPSIGITGSNGKTTTTAMTGHILRHAGIASQVGGNIGVPPTDMVATSQDGQWNVLELSSFQLETISDFSATVSVVLNLTPDHLDRHHDFPTYVAAKRRLLETQHQGAHAVLNADDAECVAFAKATIAQPFWFSTSRRPPNGAWQESGALWLADEKLMEMGEFPLPGQHNVQNALAAAAAAYLAGADRLRIAEALATFPGVEHRIEFTRELRGVRYYNDSKATNVDATEKALDAFPGGIWIILGGKDKGGDYKPLREPLRQKARAVLLIGAAAEKIEGDIGGSAPTVQSGTLESAIRYAAQNARRGDVVLLAPACASFDQFENYEHRGRTFKELVRALD